MDCCNIKLQNIIERAFLSFPPSFHGLTKSIPFALQFSHQEIHRSSPLEYIRISVDRGTESCTRPYSRSSSNLVTLIQLAKSAWTRRHIRADQKRASANRWDRGVNISSRTPWPPQPRSKHAHARGRLVFILFDPHMSVTSTLSPGTLFSLARPRYVYLPFAAVCKCTRIESRRRRVIVVAKYPGLKIA